MYLIIKFESTKKNRKQVQIPQCFIGFYKISQKKEDYLIVTSLYFRIWQYFRKDSRFSSEYLCIQPNLNISSEQSTKYADVAQIERRQSRKQ